MYDNLDFKIRKWDTGSVDFLSETPCYFDVTGEHLFEGGTVITGNLDGYKITVSENGVNLTDGSLCKYYLGDNFQTLGRGDTEKAIEKLSDTLHLHVGKATVSRIDLAQNFIVKQPIENYFNHLGELPYYKRCPMINDGSLYYFNHKNIIVFYDKVKEQKAKGRPIPELYQGRYTLRYETRYKQRLPSVFGVEKVTGALLYDEAFYIDLVKRWKNTYQAIKKINDVSINFDVMKGKKDFDLAGRLCLIEQRGGELAVLDQITEAYKRGDLTRRQADELKRATRETCKERVNFIEANEAIKELDKKVKEATRFYR